MVAQISRKTNDRTRDIGSDDVVKIVDWLEKRKAKKSLIRRIHERVDMAQKEKNDQFGENLPAGLVLKEYK
jgi:hypothetical protein